MHAFLFHSTPYNSFLFFSFGFNPLISVYTFISELICHHLPIPSYHIFSDNQAINLHFLYILFSSLSPSFLTFFYISVLFSLFISFSSLTYSHQFFLHFSFLITYHGISFYLTFVSSYPTSTFFFSLLSSSLLFILLHSYLFSTFAYIEHSFLLLSRQSILSVYYYSIRFL
jgi:hypothetical protein